MSCAGVSALAKTSIARTPAPAATVYGPLRESQPPSSRRQLAVERSVTRRPRRPAPRRPRGRRMLSRARIAPLRRVDERAVGGRLGALRVEHDRLVGGDEAAADASGTPPPCARWTSATPATLKPLKPFMPRLLDRPIWASERCSPAFAAARCTACSGASFGFAGERASSPCIGARGRDHPPARRPAPTADRDEPAARGLEAADDLAQRDRVAGVAGQRRRRSRARGRRWSRRRNSALLARQPRARGRLGRRAADAGGERAARVDERRRRAELVPRHLRADRARIGALGRARTDLALCARRGRGSPCAPSIGASRRQRRRAAPQAPPPLRRGPLTTNA